MDEQNEVKHPKAVDLGLPSGTKWASCNVGADQPWKCGGYYAWGETEEKEVYNEETYIYPKRNELAPDIWFCEDGTFEDFGYCIISTKYDVAYSKWGGNWIIPTKKHIKELLEYCVSEWTELNGVKGRKFTGPNGNSIFLPAGGKLCDSELTKLGDMGYYWSGTETPLYYDPLFLRIDSEGAYKNDFCYPRRFNGLSVRPIIPEY